MRGIFFLLFKECKNANKHITRVTISLKVHKSVLLYAKRLKTIKFSEHLSAQRSMVPCVAP